ncbi:MAG: lipoyl synthase [Spirochaetota bacterium]
MNSEQKRKNHRKPSWLNKKITYTDQKQRVGELLAGLGLNTVCRSARCPNLSECYSAGRATFMILGKKCTRNCGFCSVEYLEHSARDGYYPEDEPERIKKAAANLGLRYVVITSVTRDDLEDGGAGHFAQTIKTLKQCRRSPGVEVLTPDFQGKTWCIDIVARQGPDVFNHNVETVPRLYSRIRPQAHYQRSIRFLQYISQQYPDIFLKSGLMVGLGESREEVVDVLKDLQQAGCHAVTIGQYMRPSHANVPVARYVHPKTFGFYQHKARELGFVFAACGPYVRSSYMAEQGYLAVRRALSQ